MKWRGAFFLLPLPPKQKRRRKNILCINIVKCYECYFKFQSRHFQLCFTSSRAWLPGEWIPTIIEYYGANLPRPSTRLICTQWNKEYNSPVVLYCLLDQSTLILDKASHLLQAAGALRICKFRCTFCVQNGCTEWKSLWFCEWT